MVGFLYEFLLDRFGNNLGAFLFQISPKQTKIIGKAKENP
jgi:hypothetical protein